MLLRICPGDPDWFSVTSTPDKPTVVSAVFEHSKGDLSWRSSMSRASARRWRCRTSPRRRPTARACSSRERRGQDLQAAHRGRRRPGELLPAQARPAPGRRLERRQEQDQDEKKDEDEQDEPKPDEPKDPKDPKDQKDDKDQQPPEKPEPNKEEAKPQKPLEDALDKLDRNPQNLEAQERAQKSPLANHPPEKDW
jgi:hypothetical protein